ncbi:MAG: deoxyribodipyrimidine photo-lyase [Nitrospirae bacterium]|nr:deoxyribodipyrimidine photo-lyase [Nitrospirota bacterium]
MNPLAVSSLVDPSRVRILRPGDRPAGPVVYWMSRDQRVRDNWALLHAQDLALRHRAPLAVVFCLAPKFLGATARQYAFMLRGLEEVERGLAAKGIPFFLLTGEPSTVLPAFLNKNNAGLLVADFDPLKVKRALKNSVARAIRIPFHEVDAHNIVPCWIASPKREYGAYTLRSQLQRLLSSYLTDLPRIRKHPHRWPGRTIKTDWSTVHRRRMLDITAGEMNWIIPGERAALRTLKRFIAAKLDPYKEDRNDPNRGGQSNLSPYLHFGQLSAQRVALEVLRAEVRETSREAFLEELIVRRELSDNFCFYAPDYDGPKGFPAWAQKTLAQHLEDKREHVYTLKEFEEARTHDDLWNAAQLEMVKRGKMHGYLRMYWAKKILEWSRSPTEAMKTAIYLNDKYELDGRDPNGYAGIAWSIGGVHDRPWGERKVFGMVRYMSYNGCKSKFDVKAYITYVKGLK